MKSRPQPRLSQKEELILRCIAAWQGKPKGPRLSKEEFDTMRARVARGKPLAKNELRRLFQTFDYEQTGIAAGILIEFPPIGKRVWTRNGYGDAYSGRVIRHLPEQGKIEVEVKAWGKASTALWSDWSVTPLRSEIYMGG